MLLRFYRACCVRDLTGMNTDIEAVQVVLPQDVVSLVCIECAVKSVICTTVTGA